MRKFNWRKYTIKKVTKKHKAHSIRYFFLTFLKKLIYKIYIIHGFWLVLKRTRWTGIISFNEINKLRRSSLETPLNWSPFTYHHPYQVLFGKLFLPSKTNQILYSLITNPSNQESLKVLLWASNPLQLLTPLCWRTLLINSFTSTINSNPTSI